MTVESGRSVTVTEAWPVPIGVSTLQDEFEGVAGIPNTGPARSANAMIVRPVRKERYESDKQW